MTAITAVPMVLMSQCQVFHMSQHLHVGAAPKKPCWSKVATSTRTQRFLCNHTEKMVAMMAVEMTISAEEGGVLASAQHKPARMASGTKTLTRK